MLSQEFKVVKIFPGVQSNDSQVPLRARAWGRMEARKMPYKFRRGEIHICPRKISRADVIKIFKSLFTCCSCLPKSNDKIQFSYAYCTIHLQIATVLSAWNGSIYKALKNLCIFICQSAWIPYYSLSRSAMPLGCTVAIFIQLKMIFLYISLTRNLSCSNHMKMFPSKLSHPPTCPSGLPIRAPVSYKNNLEFLFFHMNQCIRELTVS